MKTKGYYSPKSATLYDTGGWFLVFMFSGLAFVGVIFDYFWNFLVCSLTLRWKHIDIPRNKRFIYCIIITALGFLIDWLYYELAWGTVDIGNLRMSAAFVPAGSQPILETSTILIPAVIIGLINFSISKRYFHLTPKQALLLGTAMGIFTAPWLIVAFVLLNW